MVSDLLEEDAYAQVLRSWQKKNEQELDIVAGDIVTVLCICEDKAWALCVSQDNDRGYVPSDHLLAIENAGPVLNTAMSDVDEFGYLMPRVSSCTEQRAPQALPQLQDLPPGFPLPQQGQSSSHEEDEVRSIRSSTGTTVHQEAVNASVAYNARNSASSQLYESDSDFSDNDSFSSSVYELDCGLVCYRVARLPDKKTTRDLEVGIGDLVLAAEGTVKEAAWAYRCPDPSKWGYIQKSALQPASSLDQQPWFVGKATREEIESLLLQPGVEIGTFVVRESSTTAGYVISIKSLDGEEATLRHRKCNEVDHQYTAWSQIKFRGIAELINYHSDDRELSIPYDKYDTHASGPSMPPSLPPKPTSSQVLQAPVSQGTSIPSKPTRSPTPLPRQQLHVQLNGNSQFAAPSAGNITGASSTVGHFRAQQNMGSGSTEPVDLGPQARHTSPSYGQGRPPPGLLHSHGLIPVVGPRPLRPLTPISTPQRHANQSLRQPNTSLVESRHGHPNFSPNQDALLSSGQGYSVTCEPGSLLFNGFESELIAPMRPLNHADVQSRRVTRPNYPPPPPPVNGQQNFRRIPGLVSIFEEYANVGPRPMRRVTEMLRTQSSWQVMASPVTPPVRPAMKQSVSVDHIQTTLGTGLSMYSQSEEGMSSALQTQASLMNKETAPKANPRNFTSSGTAFQNEQSQCGQRPIPPERTSSATSINQTNATAQQRNNQQEWQIASWRVIRMERVGSGYFGEVWKAKFKSNGKIVALKTFIRGIMNEELFFEEVKTMMALRHPNLVKLHGYCPEPQNIFMILDFHRYGSVLDYLRNGFSLSPSEKENVMKGVLSGMKYLSEEGFIHRDLAARNVLMADNKTPKVADFGLAKMLEADGRAVHDNQKTAWRWTAPEAICGGNLWTSKGDVWSYGVFCWELFTNCVTQPYPDIENSQCLQRHLRDGGRLGRPAECNETVFGFIYQCWELEPDKRTSFEDMWNFFRN